MRLHTEQLPRATMIIIAALLATIGARITYVHAFSGPSNLPKKVVGIYWPNWHGTPAMRDIPATYNLVYAAFAYGDGKQGGGVVWNTNDGSGVSAAGFKSDLQAAHAKGQKVLLSIGGANDKGIHLTSPGQVEQMVQSVNRVVSGYGFDGIDWDLENTSNINVASLVSASKKLKQRWGTKFIITAAPAPSATLYKDFARQLGPGLDLFSMQFYDFPASDPERIAVIKSRITEMVNTYKVPASKLGLGCKYYDPTDPGKASPPAVYRQAFNQLEATYPDLRAAYAWEAIVESANGYPFANTVGVDVRNSR